MAPCSSCDPTAKSLAAPAESVRRKPELRELMVKGMKTKMKFVEGFLFQTYPLCLVKPGEDSMRADMGVCKKLRVSFGTLDAIQN